MTGYDGYKEGVLASLPEIGDIADAELRDQVTNAWAMALAETEYERIEDIRPSGDPETPPLKNGTQADHIRGVAITARAIVESIAAVSGDLGVNADLLLACALCHDLGKPFEFSPANRERWRRDPAAAGNPSLRHTAYGAHLAINAGLPEAVWHTAFAHDHEGDLIERSLENTVVMWADRAWWRIHRRAGLLDLDAV